MEHQNLYPYAMVTRWVNRLGEVLEVQYQPRTGKYAEQVWLYYAPARAHANHRTMPRGWNDFRRRDRNIRRLNRGSQWASMDLNLVRPLTEAMLARDLGAVAACLDLIEGGEVRLCKVPAKSRAAKHFARVRELCTGLWMSKLRGPVPLDDEDKPYIPGKQPRVRS